MCVYKGEVFGATISFLVMGHTRLVSFFYYYYGHCKNLAHERFKVHGCVGLSLGVGFYLF